MWSQLKLNLISEETTQIQSNLSFKTAWWGLGVVLKEGWSLIRGSVLYKNRNQFLGDVINWFV
jgi:hypothetical protein